MLKVYIASYTRFKQACNYYWGSLVGFEGRIVTFMIYKTNDRRLAIIVGILLFIQYTFNFRTFLSNNSSRCKLIIGDRRLIWVLY